MTGNLALLLLQATTNTPTWTFLIAPVAVIFTLLINSIFQLWRDNIQRKSDAKRDEEKYRAEAEKDLRADARALRDKKREHLRPKYEAMIQAAGTMRDQLLRYKVLWEGESREERDALLKQECADATVELNNIFTSLFLEDEETQELKNLVKRISNAFQSYLDILYTAPEYKDQNTLKNEHELQDFVRELTDELVTRARAHIAKLETTDLSAFEDSRHHQTLDEPL